MKSKFPRSKATLKDNVTHPRNLYMLTIQKHNKLAFVSVDSLLEVIQHLFASIDSFRIIEHSFEVGKVYHQLHFHCLISCGYFRFLSYKSFIGFKLTWSKVTNLSGCINYIYKDTSRKECVQDEIIILNHYCHPKCFNRFIDF